MPLAVVIAIIRDGPQPPRLTVANISGRTTEAAPPPAIVSDDLKKPDADDSDDGAYGGGSDSLMEVRDESWLERRYDAAAATPAVLRKGLWHPAPRRPPPPSTDD